MASPVVFKVPDECRTFTPFPRLPPEIRHKIWRAYLSTPGIHFVKLQTWDNAWGWGRPRGRSMLEALAAYSPTDDNSEAEEKDELEMLLRHESLPQKICHARLVPASPMPQADQSHYKEIRRRLATLSSTCLESFDLVDGLVSKPGVLTLGDGSLVALDRSPDIVYLDYLPEDFFQSNCSLEMVLDCPALNRIRRAAVRFSHRWSARKVARYCSSCGKAHGQSYKGNYPTHLYQFLARHLPNLEDFYFIDYFIVPRKNDDEDEHGALSTTAHDFDREAKARPTAGSMGGSAEAEGTSPGSRQVFRAKNRAFHEASDKGWIIDPMVHQLRDWLQQAFVQYAKSSRLSRHPDPERVRFGILACEWRFSPPPERKVTGKLSPKSVIGQQGLFCGRTPALRLLGCGKRGDAGFAAAWRPCGYDGLMLSRELKMWTRPGQGEASTERKQPAATTEVNEQRGVSLPEAETAPRRSRFRFTFSALRKSIMMG